MTLERIIIVFFIVPIIAFGQKDLRTIKFNSVEGELQGHWVSSIAQDHIGLIWVGTQDGLFMYDGDNATPYRYNPLKNSLPGSYIRSIAHDTNDLFWLGVNGFGMVSFNPENNQFKIFKPSSDSDDDRLGVVIPKILIGSNNSIWFQSEYGVFRKSSENDDFKKIVGTSPSLDIESTKNGEIIIYKDSTVYHFNEKSERLESIIKNIGINEMASISENKILYKTEGKVILFDMANKSQEQIIVPEPIQMISNTVKNECYLLGSSAMYKYNSSSQKVTTYQFHNTSFNSNEINTMHLDKQGVLWVGAKQGLYQENKLGEVFKASIPYHSREIFADSSSIYIAGRSGFRTYSKNQDFEQIIDDTHILAGCKTKNGFWLGDEKGYIYFVDNNLRVKLKKRVQDTSENSFSGLYGVVEDKNGNIWVGFLGGIHVLNSEGNIISSFDLETDKTNIRLNTAKLIDKDGALWVTTVGNGVYKIPHIAQVGMNQKPFVFKNYKHIEGDPHTISSNTIYDILQDRNGILWFGTDYGISKFITNTDSFEAIKKDGEVFDYNIMSINMDYRGYFWISTIRDGIFVYDPITNNYCNLAKKEGLISDACLITSTLLYNDTLFFGTEDGVQLIDPSKFSFPETASPPFITKINIAQDTINNKSIKIYNNQVINLNHKQTDFTINFSLLNFRFPNKTNYYYKLEGLHNNWKRTKSNSVHFTNLQPGEYSFKVKASNLKSENSSHISSVEIIVKPPFYKSNLALFIYSLSLVWGLYFLYRNRINKLKAKNKTKEQILLLEKQALRAQMNPHFVFNAMNSIQYLISEGEEEKSINYLNKFSKLLRGVLENSKNEKSTLNNELSIIKNYLELEFLRLGDQFSYEIKVDDTLKEEKIDMQGLLFQPLIENAIHHGLAHKKTKGHLKIELLDKQDHMLCIIEDNGIGRMQAQRLNMEKKHKSSGLEIVKNRLSLMSKTPKEDSIKITDLYNEHGEASGTKVEIKIPFHGNQ